MERAKAWCVCIVMCCVFLMSASLAGKMAELSNEMLHHIAEYANWEDRMKCAQVSRSMRIANKAVDYKVHYPNSKFELIHPNYLLNNFIRCDRKKSIIAMRTANLRDGVVQFYTLYSKWFVKGCSLDCQTDYSPTMTVIKEKQLKEPIKGFTRSSNPNWVLITDKNDQKWAVNLHSEAKLDISQFGYIEFISDSLMVAFSKGDQSILEFKLLHIHPVNPGMLTNIHTLRIDLGSRSDDCGEVKFKVVPLRVGPSLSARIILRTFIQSDEGRRVRFIIYDQFNPKPVSDQISPDLLHQSWKIIGFDTFSSDGSKYTVGITIPGVWTGFTVYRTSDAALYVRKSLVCSATQIYSNQQCSMVAMWSNHPNFELFIHDIPNNEFLGPVLPMARPFRFAGWLTDEIFGVECWVRGTKDRFIAAVSVSNLCKEICFLPYKSHYLFCAGFPGCQTTLFSDGNTICEKQWQRSGYLMFSDFKRQRIH